MFAVVRTVFCAGLFCLAFHGGSAAAQGVAAESSSDRELEADIKEAEASLAKAPPEMKQILVQQIEALKKAQAALKRAESQAPKGRRPTLSPATQTFFTPQKPPEIPAFLPDTLQRKEVTDAQLRCPAGAKAFADELAVECRVPGARGSIPMPDGLALWFYASGKLKAQRFYQKGLLRWDVSYHAVGGRESEGNYSDPQPKTHREEGLHTDYAANGRIVKQTEYQAGKKQGWSKLWERDGFPITATRYENDKAVEQYLLDGTRKKL